MPATDTVCISFGNWIVAFYVVYALAAIALVAASAMLFDWGANKLRASRIVSGRKVSRRTQIARSRA